MAHHHSQTKNSAATEPRSRLDKFLGTESSDDHGYLVYLIIIAMLGWGLASYDFNLLVSIWALYILVHRALNGTWSGTGYAYWAESFPTRVRGAATGWLGGMSVGGFILGSGVWTLLIGSGGAVVLLIVGAGFAVLQCASSVLLPHIKPSQELEDVT